MKVKTAFALLVATMAIDSRFDVVASSLLSSSSSILDGSDPQATRKTRRMLKSKHQQTCQKETAGLEDTITELKEEIKTLQLLLKDGGGGYGSPSTTPDHSTTLKKLDSYFLNDNFWFSVPGGRFMLTYKDDTRGDVYDNAMAVQYMIRRGSATEAGPTEDRAKEILHAFANKMYCVPSTDDEGKKWRAKKNTVSGLPVQLFPRVILSTSPGEWQGDYAVGNSVFVGLAFAHASLILEKPYAGCYALAAYDIVDALWETRKCASHDFPTEVQLGTGEYYVNTESMADWVGLLNTLNQGGYYDKQVAGAVDLYKKAYNKDDPSYFVGMSCSYYPKGTNAGFDNAIAADTTFWSAMANAAMTGTGRKYSDNMINAIGNVYGIVEHKDEQSDIDPYQGFDYNGFKFSSKSNHIQWELTASAGAMSMMHSLDKHEAQMKKAGLDKVFQSRKTAYLKSITHLIEKTGSVPGSVQSKSCQTSDQGTCYYPNVAHLAASSWSGLALLMDQASDKDTFNVFAAQKGMMDRAEALASCPDIKRQLARCEY